MQSKHLQPNTLVRFIDTDGSLMYSFLTVERGENAKGEPGWNGWLHQEVDGQMTERWGFFTHKNLDKVLNAGFQTIELNLHNRKFNPVTG